MDHGKETTEAERTEASLTWMDHNAPAREPRQVRIFCVYAETA